MNACPFLHSHFYHRFVPTDNLLFRFDAFGGSKSFSFVWAKKNSYKFFPKTTSFLKSNILWIILIKWLSKWLNKTSVKHLNCKLYYQQLHLKYWCNLARYWLQAVWGWQDSVETCSNMIICDIIVCISWSEYKIMKDARYMVLKYGRLYIQPPHRTSWELWQQNNFSHFITKRKVLIF